MRADSLSTVVVVVRLAHTVLDGQSGLIYIPFRQKKQVFIRALGQLLQRQQDQRLADLTKE